MRLQRRRTPRRLQGAAFVLLCVTLLLVTRVFQYFPGFGPIQELGFLLPLLAFLPMWLHLKRNIPVAQRRGLFMPYALGVMVLMPLWAGVMAQLVHGQPWYFGVLSLRGYAMITIPVLLLCLLQAGRITLQDLDRALMTCAWFTMVIYVAMTLVLNPADFVNDSNTFVENRNDDGVRFKFSNALLLYALFSHGVKALRQRSWLHLLPALALLAWMVGSAGGRILTLGVMLTTLLMLSLWGNFRTVMSGIAGMSLVIGLAVGIGTAVDSEATHERLNKFKDAFEVFAADIDLIDDSSAASRVLQTLIALPYIEESPLLGNGRISAQWIEGGYKGLIGEHFFPDDIGVFGMLMQFGVFGTLVLYGQFLLAIVLILRWKASGRKGPNESVVLACAAYAIYESLASLANADAMMFPELTLLPIAVLTYAARASAAPPRRRRATEPGEASKPRPSAPLIKPIPL